MYPYMKFTFENQDKTDHNTLSNQYMPYYYTLYTYPSIILLNSFPSSHPQTQNNHLTFDFSSFHSLPLHPTFKARPMLEMIKLSNAHTCTSRNADLIDVEMKCLYER